MEENTPPSQELNIDNFEFITNRIIECAPYEQAELKEPAWYRVRHRLNDTQMIIIDVPTMPELMSVINETDDDVFFDVSDELSVTIQTLQDILEDGTIIINEESFLFYKQDKTTSYREEAKVFDPNWNYVKPPRPDLNTEEGIQNLINQLIDKHELGAFKITEDRLARLMHLLDCIQDSV